MKKTDSDIQYAVSIKEDTALSGPAFTKDPEGNRMQYTENPGESYTSYSSNGYPQKDKNKAKTGQNRARDWKERGKLKPKEYASGNDEVKLTDEEYSDFDYEDEVAEVFKIDTNVFDFETPMCKAFKEFNYLLQIDPDLLTKDIEGSKTYDGNTRK
ncbi:hypothetical protein Tco_1403394 [Tanacetum coccineum]